MAISPKEFNANTVSMKHVDELEKKIDLKINRGLYKDYITHLEIKIEGFISNEIKRCVTDRFIRVGWSTVTTSMIDEKAVTTIFNLYF